MNSPDTISAETLHERIKGGENAVIIDVREVDEYRSVHAVGAVLLPLARVDADSVNQYVSEGATAYFICHSGRRATEACERVLADFPDAIVVEGGTLAWAQAGLPVHSGGEP
ncbi:MAG: rhodanese-like domain-containing protein [Gammaproteobacteria bacterium]|nr:rhodanese-like domain-containing protein [Gammaproteobacteria bacterium]